MSKKNSQADKEKLWSKRFDENSNYSDEPLSRSARKKAERGIPPILTTTIIFLVLIIVLPVGAYIWWSNDPVATENDMAQTEESIQVSKNSTSVQPQSSNTVEETEEEAEEEVSEETPDTESQPEVAPDNSPSETETVQEPVEEPVEEPIEEPVEEQPVEETPPAEEESVETSHATYTVKQGDNLYRIALNHNMTTDELKQLNGISTDEVRVGTVLRVE